MTALEQTTAIEIKETRISFSETGKGEAVLFLHGNPGSRKDFAGIQARADSLACRLIMPDRPGHNGSEELINEANDVWLDIDVYAELIDRRCNGSAWLFGYSMGCHIAARIAMRHPGKVKGIIMTAPYLTPDNPSEKPTSIPDLAKGAVLGTALGLVLPLVSQTKMQQHLEKVFMPTPLADDFRETWLPRYTRFESLMAMMTDKNNMLKTLNEVKEGMKGLKCPVYVIFGEKDAVCSVEKQKQIIAECIPTAKQQSIPEGGHALPLTHTEDCIRTIKEALQIQ